MQSTQLTSLVVTAVAALHFLQMEAFANFELR